MKKRAICFFLAVWMMIAVLPISAYADISRDATMAVGSTAEYSHYSSSASSSKRYSWEVTSGSDILRIVSGESGVTVTVEALKTGKAVLTGTATRSSSFGRVYHYYHKVTITVIDSDYRIQFDANGGKVSTSGKTVSYGETYGTLPTPTKSGYSFQGWFTKATGGKEVKSTQKVTIQEDLTLYAHWKADSYKVTFNPNGGSVGTKSKNVTKDGTYGTLPTPTRSGYTFQGWYTKASGGTKITSSTKVTVTADQTLYAHWTSAPASAPTSSPTHTSAPKHTSDPDSPFCPTCDGLGDCPNCFGEGELDCPSCAFGRCTKCGGMGTIMSYGGAGKINERTCSSCGGTGDCRKCGGDGYLVCSRCHGHGDCPTCGGTGFKSGRSL